MYCIKCGKEINDGADFCQYCGQKQEEATEKNDKNEKKSPSDSKLLLIGVILAAAILVIIAVIRLCGNKPQSTVTESVVTETQTEINSESETIEESQPIESESTTTDVADVTETIEETTEEEEDEAVEPVQTPMIKYIKSGSYEYWFDEDGDLIKTLEVYDHDTMTCTTNIQYLLDSNGNKVKIYEGLDIDFDSTYFDSSFLDCSSSSGHLIEKKTYEYQSGDVTTISFEYDDKNRPVKKTEEYKDITDNRTSTEKMIVEYKEDLQQIVASTYRDDSKSGTTTWMLNGKRLISYNFSNTDYSYIVEYDGSGNCIRYYDGGMETKYQYDNKGNLIRQEHCEEYSSFTYYTAYEYQYDDHDRKIKMECISHEFNNPYLGYAAGDSQSTEDYQYDDNGNLIKREEKSTSQEYDEAGTMIRDTTDNRTEIWEYDEENKLTAYSFLSKDLSSEDLNESNIRYLYDEQGKLIEIMENGETAVIINYTDTGMIKEVTCIKEISDYIYSDWKLPLSDLFDFIPSDIRFYSQDIVIEYR